MSKHTKEFEDARDLIRGLPDSSVVEWYDEMWPLLMNVIEKQAIALESWSRVGDLARKYSATRYDKSYFNGDRQRF